MKTKDCVDCKGTGECATCDGTGKVAKTSEAAKTKGKAKEMTNCTDCEGSGDCPTCDGEGTVKAAEAAGAAGENNMDEKEVKRLIESTVGPLKTELAETKVKLAEATAKSDPLLARALKGDAIEAAAEALSGITMRPEGKQYVISECIKSIPIKDGALDTVAFKESVTAKAKELAPLMSQGPRIIDMGVAPVLDVKESAQKESDLKRLQESEESAFSVIMGGNREAAKAALKKGVAA